VWPFVIIAVLAFIALWLGVRWRQSIAQLEALQTVVNVHRDREDATARHMQAERAAIFDNMVEGVVLLDQDGRIQLANKPFLQFFAIPSDPAGQTLIEATRDHQLATLLAGLDAARHAASLTLRRSADNSQEFEVNAAAVFGEDQRRRGTVIVVHDLTHLRKLERTREEFVANVSHELRTPLSLIKGYTETLLDGAQGNPEVARKFLQTIDRNAERLKLLIEDLLTISELESGRMRLQTEALPLQPLVAKLLDDFKPRAVSRGVTLVNQMPALSAQADPNRIQQVLSNLVDNAIKYGRNDGTVTISGRNAAANMVELCVTDDGPGIPAEACERVFERFYRVDKARSREQGGTGLGLSIVKHIVQSHGGKVWVESEPGQGCRFFFSLPGA
jgi:two-component system phosphate regulon sensor histidine kinase PhoR